MQGGCCFKCACACICLVTFVSYKPRYMGCPVAELLYPACPQKSNMAEKERLCKGKKTCKSVVRHLNVGLCVLVCSGYEDTVYL